MPGARQTFYLRVSSGCSQIEEGQLDLLKTICDIALYGSAAHEKIGDPVIRSTKMLSDLAVKL